MLSKLITLIFILVGGCDAPRRGVMVTREADHYVVSLLNCGPPRWGNPPVWEVNVGKFHSNESIDVQCKLMVSFKQGDGGDDSLKQWHFGSQPKGYNLEHCAPLEPDTTYEVNIFARPGLAKGHFTVNSNGDVTMIDGPCRR